MHLKVLAAAEINNGSFSFRVTKQGAQKASPICEFSRVIAMNS